ncbi:LpqN/LpqT family lipoprotein [Mycobacterium sp. pW049]|uniref:LpqN/LpqT family lipoprotein n=1 Tax=[Mycobacterium] bulgaricum TaxID=3238985 RepID=UPI00351B2E93
MTTWRTLFAITTATALLLTGCSQNVTGTAVTAAAGDSAADGGDETQCVAVDAPLDDIPNEDEGEPLLRIPVPDGWERNSMMDSEIIRYTIVSTDLISNDFAPNAVVTLESVRGIEAPEDVFEQNRANLESGLGAFDLEPIANSTCGLPSETTYYVAPPMGPAPERPIIMHAVVAESGGSTYLATVTIQTTDPGDAKYVTDSQEIIDGFQMLVPGS